ncbi:MAG TPA: pentapeptide repeat-containing protein, partial [Stenomitos sp.]
MYKPKEAKLFGAALKRLLYEKELSDRQFAKQAGLEQSYVSKLLNPKPGKEIAEPRKKTRQQLAQGLGITEQELLEQIARYSDSEAEKTISAPPGLAESEEAIAKSHRESVESDAGLIEERYFRATSNFDSLEPLERKSRIQVLEDIASNKDFPRYHWKVMEFLADFVRRKAPRKEEEEGEDERLPKISDDIQAALTVIGQRDTKKDPENQRLDLSHTDIRGANLREARLQRINFSAAQLQEADLCEAKLQGTYLIKANLKETQLVMANLEEAYMHQANLEKAQLLEAVLRRTRLPEANLKDADFYNANLEFADLRQANLE